MIPGKYEYQRPKDKGEALVMLQNAGFDGRPLAGGHSLIPMMKLRMATPETLVDISRLEELRGISAGGNIIRIGASTTQHEMINDAALTRACPIIKEAALLVADPQVRYCGTLGGNVGNGDPGNDMPALMQCLDAAYILESTDGERRISARVFYQGAYFTVLEPGEMITAIEFQTPASGHGYAYEKLKRKVGDYATAAAAVVLSMSGGRVTSASIALTNLADTPLYAEEASGILSGSDGSDAIIDQVVAAAEAIVSPTADGRGSVEYRTKMAGIMTRNAVSVALARAAG